MPVLTVAGAGAASMLEDGFVEGIPGSRIDELDGAGVWETTTTLPASDGCCGTSLPLMDSAELLPAEVCMTTEALSCGVGCRATASVSDSVEGAVRVAAIIAGAVACAAALTGAGRGILEAAPPIGLDAANGAGAGATTDAAAASCFSPPLNTMGTAGASDVASTAFPLSDGRLTIGRETDAASGCLSESTIGGCETVEPA